jgi:ligand-binding sensor domain-containing protein
MYPKVRLMTTARSKLHGSAWAPILIILFVITFFSSRADAIDPTETLSELNHTRWTVREGAPPGESVLAQSSDGYLWIGANTGLFRFDGEHFEFFSSSTGGHPITGSVSALLAITGNGLLVGMRFGGAFLVRDGHVSHFAEHERLPAHSVTAFAARNDGSLWAQTTAGLYRFDGQVWHEVGEDWGYPARTGIH